MTAPQLSAEDENTNRDDDKRENARVGYESAINLWGYIEEQIWADLPVVIAKKTSNLKI